MPCPLSFSNYFSTYSESYFTISYCHVYSFISSYNQLSYFPMTCKPYGRHLITENQPYMCSHMVNGSILSQEGMITDQ